MFRTVTTHPSVDSVALHFIILTKIHEKKTNEGETKYLYFRFKAVKSSKQLKTNR